MRAAKDNKMPKSRYLKATEVDCLLTYGTGPAQVGGGTLPIVVTVTWLDRDAALL